MLLVCIQFVELDESWRLEIGVPGKVIKYSVLAWSILLIINNNNNKQLL